MKRPYELTFWGGIPIRYRRHHETLESARELARKLLAEMPNRGAHPAVIYRKGYGHPIAAEM